MKLGKWKLFEKRTIFGCDARGDADSAYLTRWTILGAPNGVGLHLLKFHRSDADVCHDHPWSFASLILWRGYVEETPGKTRQTPLGEISGEPLTLHEWVEYPKRRRIWPGMLLFRPADWIHRVDLVDEKPAITLIVTGPYQRQWGFHTTGGWKHWREYFADKGCQP